MAAELTWSLSVPFHLYRKYDGGTMMVMTCHVCWEDTYIWCLNCKTDCPSDFVQVARSVLSQTRTQGSWEADIYMFDAVQSNWLQKASLCCAEKYCNVVQRIHHQYCHTTTGRKYPSVGQQSHLAPSASMLFLPHFPTVTTIKLLRLWNLESAGLCSLLHQLIMFYEHVVSFSSHHMQPDVLTWISSTSECCAVLWSYVQGKRHITEEANVFGSSSWLALWPQVLTGHVAIAAMKYFHLNPAFP